MNIWLTLLLVCVSHNSEGFARRMPMSDDKPTETESVTVTTELSKNRHRTSIEYHPHQVSMVNNDDNRNFCGGFIVSERFIITAAHCVEKSEPSNLELYVGSTVRLNGTIVAIEEVTPHPRYNTTSNDLDVAVLKTVYKINYTEVVQPIPLAPLGRVIVENGAIEVSGWGTESAESEVVPFKLEFVQLPVVNQDKCYESYPNTLTVNQFCAGYFYLGGPDACLGDSGGVAVQDGLAVGIVSYGRGCGEPGSPSVYADISAKAIREFIAEQTGL